MGAAAAAVRVCVCVCIDGAVGTICVPALPLLLAMLVLLAMLLYTGFCGGGATAGAAAVCADDEEGEGDEDVLVGGVDGGRATGARSAAASWSKSGSS